MLNLSTESTGFEVQSFEQIQHCSDAQDLSDCLTSGSGDIAVLGSHRLSCRCKILI